MIAVWSGKHWNLVWVIVIHGIRFEVQAFQRKFCDCESCERKGKKVNCLWSFATNVKSGEIATKFRCEIIYIQNIKWIFNIGVHRCGCSRAELNCVLRYFGYSDESNRARCLCSYETRSIINQHSRTLVQRKTTSK